MLGATRPRSGARLSKNRGYKSLDTTTVESTATQAFGKATNSLDPGGLHVVSYQPRLRLTQDVCR